MFSKQTGPDWLRKYQSALTMLIRFWKQVSVFFCFVFVCVFCFFFFSNLTLNLNKALCSIGMGSSQCVSAGGEVELPAMEITPVEHCNKFEDCYG